MTVNAKTVTVCGDVLAVERAGSVWVSPVNGQQHSSARDAMRAEIEAYLSACGEDVDSEEASEEIEGYLDQMA